MAVGFKIPGHVANRYVDEGQTVNPGQPMAELETADLEAEVDLAARAASDQAALAEMPPAIGPTRSPPRWPQQKAEANTPRSRTEAGRRGSRAASEIHRAEADRPEKRSGSRRRTPQGRLGRHQGATIRSAPGRVSHRTTSGRRGAESYEMVKPGPERKTSPRARPRWNRPRPNIGSSRKDLARKTSSRPRQGSPGQGGLQAAEIKLS